LGFFDFIYSQKCTFSASPIVRFAVPGIAPTETYHLVTKLRSNSQYYVYECLTDLGDNTFWYTVESIPGYSTISAAICSSTGLHVEWIAIIVKCNLAK